MDVGRHRQDEPPRRRPSPPAREPSSTSRPRRICSTASRPTASGSSCTRSCTRGGTGRSAGRSPTRSSPSFFALPAHPGRRVPGRPARHRQPALPHLRRHVLPDRQPHPRRVRFRRHRDRLLRRLDRSGACGAATPARRPSTSSSSSARSRRSSKAGRSNQRKLNEAPWTRAQGGHQDGEVVDLDGRRAADVLDVRRVLRRVGGRWSAGSRPTRSRGRAPLFVIAFLTGAILFDFALVPRSDVHDCVSVRPPAERAVRPGHDPRRLRREARRPEGEAEGPQRGGAGRRLHRLPRLRQRVPDRHRHQARAAARVHRDGAVHRRVRRGDDRAAQADRPDPLHLGA